MQNQMNNQKPLFALIPVPLEALANADLNAGDLLQVTAEDGKVTMERIDPREVHFVCDGDCDCCPVSEMDCQCEDCPCYENCEEGEVF